MAAEVFLFDEGFEIKLPAFEGDELAVFEAHKENLLLCDATIIYYGNTTDSWLSAKLADSFRGRMGFNRQVIFNITPNRYELRLDACDEAGEDCVEGTYSYVAQRHQG